MIYDYCYTTIGLCKGFYASFYLKISKMIFNVIAASIAAGIKVIKVINVFKISSAPCAAHARKGKRKTRRTNAARLFYFDTSLPYLTAISTSALMPHSKPSGCSSNAMTTGKTTSPPRMSARGEMRITLPGKAAPSASMATFTL